MQLQLLATCAKLFFRRPAEIQRMLGRLLDAAIADASYTDVHDRAMLYYRLLLGPTQRAEQILTKSAVVVGAFVEEVESELQDKIFSEFNTLAVIYGAPSDRFIKGSRTASLATAGGTAVAAAAADAAAESSSEEEEDDDLASNVAAVDLLGLDDVLSSSSPETAAPALALSPAAAVDAPTFQQRWMASPQLDAWTVQAALSGGVDNLPKAMAPLHVKCMAFGNVGDQAKFYFYAQETAAGVEEMLLVELLVSRTSLQASGVVKGGRSGSAQLLSSLLRGVLEQ